MGTLESTTVWDTKNPRDNRTPKLHDRLGHPGPTTDPGIQTPLVIGTPRSSGRQGHPGPTTYLGTQNPLVIRTPRAHDRLEQGEPTTDQGIQTSMMFGTPNNTKQTRAPRDHGREGHPDSMTGTARANNRRGHPDPTGDRDTQSLTRMPNVLSCQAHSLCHSQAPGDLG